MGIFRTITLLDQEEGVRVVERTLTGVSHVTLRRDTDPGRLGKVRTKKDWKDGGRCKTELGVTRKGHRGDRETHRGEGPRC